MSERKVLSAEDILGAADFTCEFVAVPEWANGDARAGVWVRSLSGTDRDAFEAAVYAGGKRNLTNVRARLCALCMVGADQRTRLFSDHQAQALGQKSAAALDRVFNVACRLNALSARDVENLAKN